MKPASPMGVAVTARGAALLAPFIRLGLALLTMLIATGCAPRGSPAATTLPGTEVQTIAELLEVVPQGTVRAVGFLYETPEGAIVVDSLRAGERGGFVPAEGLGLWLDSAPQLPADNLITRQGAARYTLVDARGQLEGPGQFGPGGRYAFRLAAPALKPLSARELTIQQLIENSDAHENQPVRLRAQLLAGLDGAILVEQLGPGGVPAGDALQIKLELPPRDPAVAAALSSAANPEVRFGLVELTGLWRDGRLYPLLASVAR